MGGMIGQVGTPEPLQATQIRATLLPMHQIAVSAPLVAKGQEGGP